LRDSKALSEKKRPAIAQAVRASFSYCALGEASAQEIDEGGIMKALGTAVVRGLQELARQGVAVGSSVLLLDGSNDFVTPRLPHPLAVVTKEKADRDCVSVAAASVIAKVHRDNVMIEHAAKYPEYGFASNKGYGSAGHRDAISEHGVTSLHRRTWIHF
jgi:ribonuclease HII